MTDWYQAGCTTACRDTHTKASGTCAYGPERIPMIVIGRTKTLDDGQRGTVMYQISEHVWDDILTVLEHVSVGKSAAFHQERHYPDATARFALGALYDAGIVTRGERDRHTE